MPRLYLTAREYDALLRRQRGKCCVRGCKATEGLIAEHSTPNAIHPGKPDHLRLASAFAPPHGAEALIHRPGTRVRDVAKAP